MGDAGVGHQALQVRLGEGQGRAVEDPHGPQGQGRGGEALRRLGEQRHGEADQAVAAGLQEQPGQDHAPRRRGLGVGVREPGVERHRRELHREGDEESQHQPGARRPRRRAPQELAVGEGPLPGGPGVGCGQGQDRHQHEEAARLGEEEELDRRVDPALVAPDADQEVHRHQHELPEEVEQEEVQGQEHAHHPGQDPEEVEVEEAHPVVDLAPGAPHGEDPQDRRQEDQDQGEAVHRQGEGDAEPGDPVPGEAGDPVAVRREGGGPRPEPESRRQHQVHRHGAEGHPARGRRATAGEGPRQEAAHEGHRHQGQEGHGSTPRRSARPRIRPRSSTAPAASAAAYQRTRPVWVRARPRWPSRTTAATLR